MFDFGKKKELQNREEVEAEIRKKYISELSFLVRNPLNTICGVTEIVRKNIVSGSDKEIVLSYLDILSDASVELQQVIDQGFKGFEEENYKMDIADDESEEEVDSEILKNLRVLVVEDSSVSQLIAKEMLESRDAIVTVCDSGVEALEIFEKSITGTFDVIFMDINMPGMDGYEATDAIRNCNHPQAKSIPIIAMTAEALADDVQMALKAGMNAHISKPIAIDKIVSALKATK